MELLAPAADGDPRVPPHRGVVPEPRRVLLEREKGCSHARECVVSARRFVVH